MTKYVKEAKTNDDDGIAPTSSHGAVGEALQHKATTHDAVFGEITEGGPNYRNVSTVVPSLAWMLNSMLSGWMDRHGCFDDEDSDRAWRPLYPFRVQRFRSCTRCRYSMRDRCHHHVVELYRRGI